MEDWPPIWRVAANILNNSGGQTTRGGPPPWGLGEVLTFSRRKKVTCYEIFTRKASDLDWISGTNKATCTHTYTITQKSASPNVTHIHQHNAAGGSSYTHGEPSAFSCLELTHLSQWCYKHLFRVSLHFCLRLYGISQAYLNYNENGKYNLNSF